MAVCIDFAAHIAECYGVDENKIEYYASYCTCGLSYYETYYGVECADAVEAVYACLNALACEELESDEACGAEIDAFDVACGFQ